MKLQKRDQKGSNTNYKVKIKHNKPLCFSFHPLHSANAHADSGLDRGRNRSLQQFTAQARTALIHSGKLGKK